jgi:hypothetical protein
MGKELDPPKIGILLGRIPKLSGAVDEEIPEGC